MVHSSLCIFFSTSGSVQGVYFTVYSYNVPWGRPIDFSFNFQNWKYIGNQTQRTKTEFVCSHNSDWDFSIGRKSRESTNFLHYVANYDYVLVSLGHHSHELGGLELQKFIPSHVGRPEVWRQVSPGGSSWEALRTKPSHAPLLVVASHVAFSTLNVCLSISKLASYKDTSYFQRLYFQVRNIHRSLVNLHLGMGGMVFNSRKTVFTKNNTLIQ